MTLNRRRHLQEAGVDEVVAVLDYSPGRYPSQLEGKTFAELSQWVSAYSATQTDNPLLLLGVRQGSDKILLNPKPQSFDRLAADDALVVMAFRKVDWIN